MSALEEPEEVRPVRNILRDYVNEAVRSGGNVVTQESLIMGARAKFANDEEFIVAAARDIVPALMPDLFREAFHHRKQAALSVTSGWLSKEPAGIKLTVRERIDLVYEGTGQGAYKKLLSCTKLDLCRSRDRNWIQGNAMIKWGNLEDDLQALLPNDDDVLGGVVSEDVVAEIWTKHGYPGD
jgi:hypothetical protein